MKPTEQLHEMQQSHAVFQQVGECVYRVEKDRFQHFSIGSIISGQMLNAYKGIVPSSARITIFYLDSKGRGTSE